MEQNLIVIKQLPVIEEQLQAVKATVIQRVQDALNLSCTAESAKEIKRIRAELNKEYKALDERRKEVKAAIMQPYNNFESVFKDCVSPYKEADQKLKEKIDTVEKEVKNEKAAEVESYFDEYAASLDIDFVNFEDLGLNITLSASLKSLKAEVKDYLDHIADDVKTIHMVSDEPDYIQEVMYEYTQGLNLTVALERVKERHEAIERAKQAAKQTGTAEPEVQPQAPPTETPLQAPLQAPTVEEPTEEILTLRFKVRGTRTQLRALKAFLENGGYDYE